MTEQKKRGRPPGSTKAAMEARKTEEAFEVLHKDDAYYAGEVASSIDVMYGQLANMGDIFSVKEGRIPRLPGTLRMSVPGQDDFDEQRSWAIKFRNLKFIKGALLRRRKFIISGFKHHHEDEKVVALFDKIAKDTKFIKTLKQIQWEKDTVGWVVAWPDQINRIPQAVHLLQGNIRIERSMGYDRILLKLDDNTIKSIKANPERYPSYFLEEVTRLTKNSYGGFVLQEIELRDAYLISSIRDIGSAYPQSPLYPLFEPIKIIDAVVEAQYAILHATKQLIMHAKVTGEVDTQGNQKTATRSQLAAVAKQLINGAKTSTIITDAGVEVEFISPDKDIFDATKTPYEQAITRINDNINIPMVLVSGKADGISYSTGTFIIKGFLQDVIDEREDLLTDFVYPWYKKIAQGLYESNPKKYAFLKRIDNDGVDDNNWNIPLIQFNETELKDMVQLLAMLRFLQDTGAQSVESIYELLGMDYRTEKSRKEKQNKEDGWIYRPFEASQGMARSESFENMAQANIENMRKNADLNERNFEEKLKIKKTELKNQSKLNNSSAGTPGRPTNELKTPTADSENRNPRTATASEINDIINEELTVDSLMALIDQPEKLAGLLNSIIPPAERFFDEYPDSEDINNV